MEKGVKNLNAAARSAGRRRSVYEGDDSGGSMGEASEWAPDMSQSSSSQLYQSELTRPPPEYQHLQLPPPRTLFPPGAGSSGLTIPPMMSTPPANYGSWYPSRP